jgi:hypothetical protein
MMEPIEVVDSHTAGEPTRVVIRGGPALGAGTLAQRRDVFRREFDRFRTAIVTEPRGSDVMVGALLCKPSDPAHLAGVIFFNNVGYLGMCGHGMIGLVETLRYLGRIGAGEYKIETPVGTVEVSLRDDATVSVRNVISYRLAGGVEVDVDGIGTVSGDVAWGGNWFFLTSDCPEPLRFERVGRLQQIAVERRDIPKWIMSSCLVVLSPRERIPATSYSARDWSSIVHPAEPARLPSWPAWRPTVSSRRGSPGFRRGFWGPVLRPLTVGRTRTSGESNRQSPDRLS